MADIAYEVDNGVYKIENSAIQRAFEIAGITVTSVLNGDTATMTLNEDIDDDGVPENQQTFTLTGGTETFDTGGFEVKQDNEIWLSFDFEDDGDITDAGRIEDVTFQPETFALGLTEISNYLEDDWNDNRLTDREWRNSDVNQGVFAHPDANEAGDTLIGRYRPEWGFQENLVDLGVSNNRLEFGPLNDNSVSSVIATPSDITLGKWNADITFTTIGNDNDSVRLNTISGPTTNSNQDFNDSLILYKGDSGLSNEFSCKKTVGGTFSDVITSTWSGDTSTHTSTLTRNSYGDIEILEDGVSKGTASDTYIPEQNVLFGITVGDSNGGSEGYIDNLVIQ